MRAEHVGREAELVVLGRTWRLGRWERRVWEQFLDWAKPRIPDPLVVAKRALEMLPAHLHDGIVRHALDQASLALTSNSPQVRSLMGSIDGTVHLLALLLKEHHPEADDDLAMRIAAEAGAEKLKEAFDRCAGKAPEAVRPNEPAPAG